MDDQPHAPQPYAPQPYVQHADGGNALDGPYGAAVPAPPAPPLRTNGIAIAALVVGCIALLLDFSPLLTPVGAVAGVVGLVLGIVGLRRATGGTGGRGVAIGGICTGAAALVVGGTITAFTFFVLQEASKIDVSVPDVGPTSVPAPADPQDGSWEIDEAEHAELVQVPPLLVGEASAVGSYTVTVTGVTPDADATLAAMPGNPLPHHQYVLVDVTLTNNGTEPGDPVLDTSVSLIGTDLRVYPTYACLADTPVEVWVVGRVQPGATVAYQVCMDAPEAVVSQGTVRISPSDPAAGETSSYWTVP